MGEAKGHKFGQTLGDYCEEAVEPLLQQFAAKHGLYLDKQGTRPARSGKKVKWVDDYGNSHDLDFVLERDGTATKIGTPVAFIESAWRRYTKHSRAKAQEIQGAIMPVCDRHRYCAPFKGCFLVGEYTSGAREQLASMRFTLLHFDYPTILEAFKIVGIDARFDEDTPDEDFADKQQKWENLSAADKSKLWDKLLELNRAGVKTFMDALEKAVTRTITEVRVIPLHGKSYDCKTVQEAIEFVAAYNEADTERNLLYRALGLRIYYPSEVAAADAKGLVESCNLVQVDKRLDPEKYFFASPKRRPHGAGRRASSGNSPAITQLGHNSLPESPKDLAVELLFLLGNDLTKAVALLKETAQSIKDVNPDAGGENFKTTIMPPSDAKSTPDSADTAMPAARRKRRAKSRAKKDKRKKSTAPVRRAAV